MKHIEYQPHGVCSKKIIFEITKDNKIVNLQFIGGCQGNLSALAKVLNGYDIDEVIRLLEGNKCGIKNTSCTDQLTKALKNNK